MSFEGCGYCKECVRTRVMKAVGRTPDAPMECAYKHILDAYIAAPEHSKGAPEPPGSAPPSPGDSCPSNCRWTSSGSSSKPSYDDMNFSDDYEDMPRLFRKRIQFVKRKKI